MEKGTKKKPGSDRSKEKGQVLPQLVRRRSGSDFQQDGGREWRSPKEAACRTS